MTHTPEWKTIEMGMNQVQDTVTEIKDIYAKSNADATLRRTDPLFRLAEQVAFPRKYLEPIVAEVVRAYELLVASENEPLVMSEDPRALMIQTAALVLKQIVRYDLDSGRRTAG